MTQKSEEETESVVEVKNVEVKPKKEKQSKKKSKSKKVRDAFCASFKQQRVFAGTARGLAV